MLPGSTSERELDEWANNVDEVSAQIRGIIDGTITDFDEFDRKLNLKDRAKQIREEEARARREKFFLYGTEGKGEGTKYRWWCKRCFVEYTIDLPNNSCTRCQKPDMMMTQEARREELMGKLERFKEDRTKHQWRKDKWLRWKKSQALLGRSRNINYKAWEFWEPDTDSEEEGEPIVPKDNPEFQAMEADLKARHKKGSERAKTAEKCRLRGNQCMAEGDFTGAIEHYEEGLEYKRDSKVLWTNKALAEVKVFRWHDAIASCNKVIEYSEIFEGGFTKSADSCFKAFIRRALALRALHKWEEALMDIEDALKLMPKDREARDLYEKTTAAAEEARRVRALVEKGTDKETKPENTHQQSFVTSTSKDVLFEDDTGLKIEELPDDQQPAPPNSSFLTGMSKQDWETLLQRLKGSESERVLFCARGQTSCLEQTSSKDTWVGRKVNLKVEEVQEPSKLDQTLRDAERCCILWKKLQGELAKTAENEDKDKVRERQEAQGFLGITVPRVVQVLLVLARCSDHHCTLTATAIKHVWPLLTFGTTRQTVLELLLEWSQRSITAKSMVEFAGRYPDPHLRLLLGTVLDNSQSNTLPPGFEETREEASKLLEKGEKDMDAALEQMLQGLAVPSPCELGLSTIGNLCAAGHKVAAFKEKLLPFRDELVGALQRRLNPLDARLCGKAAGAVCNVLRMGEEFVSCVHRQCTKPLIDCLKEEVRPDGPIAMMRQFRGHLPMGLPSSKGRLLGALVNLLILNPGAVQEVQQLGALDIVATLIDPVSLTATCISLEGDDEEGSSITMATRAAQLAARMINLAPSSLTPALEAVLLKRLYRTLQLAGNFSDVRQGVRGLDSIQVKSSLERLDLVCRMLTIVLTRTPGALDRLVERRPRVEELPDDCTELPVSEPTVPFLDLVGRLIDLAAALQPHTHVSPDDMGGAPSRMRGNLALLFGALSQAQCEDDAPPVLRDLGLGPLVDIFVETLRKERGPAQHNIGVCVTRLAQNPRYRQQVRDVNGLESLHQIQLPKVEAQKADADKRHRLATSESAREAELAKLRKRREQLHGPA